MVCRCQKGFTLIELIVVIVLLGIMSAGAGLLISRPIEAYSDQLRRQQLVDSAEMSVRKLEVDIRRALPNSIRIDVSNMPTSWALEMVNTLDGGRYRDDFQLAGGFNLAEHVLQFASADSEFNILGLFSDIISIPATLPNKLRAVIYNTNATAIYNDAVTVGAEGIISYPAGLGITEVTASGVDEHHLVLPSAFKFTSRSPTQRLFVVDGSVSYICDAASGYLTRFSDYQYQSTQITSFAGLAALSGVKQGRVATQLAGCGISYQPGVTQRSGLVTLDLTLTDSENESVRLLHQVHVDNVP